MAGKPKLGRLDGQYWVWPDGRKTHIRFIAMAVSRMKPLPKGFYDAVKKANIANLTHLVRKAKYLGLKDSVTKP